jgi:hypothetical protein
MGKREELEAELARGEAFLARAEARLRKAEAELHKAAIRHANANGGRADTVDALESARDVCRVAHADRHHSLGRRDQLRAALVELDHHALPSGNSSAQTDELIKTAEGPGPGTTAYPPDGRASPRSTRSSGHAVGNAEKRQENITDGKKPFGSFALPRCEYLAPVDMHAWRSLTRRIVIMLALLLAYLQYYFLDVNLQIARLPSIVLLLLG